MTDEDVARAAGWRETPRFYTAAPPTHKTKWESPDGFLIGSANILPAFTTSLDAITRQIEAEGLAHALSWQPHRPARAWVGDGWGREAPTAALALCRAYVAYKEGSK